METCTNTKKNPQQTEENGDDEAGSIEHGFYYSMWGGRMCDTL
jgi:hypothetical protein